MKESEIQKTITQWLTAKGVFWRRMHIGPVMRGSPMAPRFSKNPMRGFADIWGFVPGTTRGEMFAIEVKAAKGRLSPEQKEWREIYARFGVRYVEARSLDDVINALQFRSAL